MLPPKIYHMLYKAFISTYSFLFSFYKPIEININKKLSRTFYIILLSMLIFFYFSAYSGLKFEQIIFFKWRYITAYEYILFCIITFYISEYKTKNTIHSLDYTIQASYSCGLLYELPNFFAHEPIINIFLKYWTLLQIQSTIFLIYKLHKLKLKIDNKIIIIFIFWILFSIIAYLNVEQFFLLRPMYKLVRIPTMILLIALICNVESVYI